MKKNICIFLLSTIVLLSGCQNESLNKERYYLPTWQKSTLWVNGEQDFIIVGTEFYRCFGLIKDGNHALPVDISMHNRFAQGNFDVYPMVEYDWKDGELGQVPSSKQLEVKIESWGASFVAENEFNVDITETTFFPDRSAMTFSRIVSPEDGEALNLDSSITHTVLPVGTVWKDDANELVLVFLEKNCAFGTYYDNGEAISIVAKVDSDDLYIVSADQFDFGTREVRNYTSSNIMHYKIAEIDTEKIVLENDELSNNEGGQAVCIYRATAERLYGQ